MRTVEPLACYLHMTGDNNNISNNSNISKSTSPLALCHPRRKCPNFRVKSHVFKINNFPYHPSQGTPTPTMASFPNIYTHRKVADTAAKPCSICYKPSSSVMVTAENKVGNNWHFTPELPLTGFAGLLLYLSKPFEGQAIRDTRD